jgi:uncharacterized membrane protein YvbJ
MVIKETLRAEKNGNNYDAFNESEIGAKGAFCAAISQIEGQKAYIRCASLGRRTRDKQTTPCNIICMYAKQTPATLKVRLCSYL